MGSDRDQSTLSPNLPYDIESDEKPSEAVVTAVAALTMRAGASKSNSGSNSIDVQ